LQRKQNARIVY